MGIMRGSGRRLRAKLHLLFIASRDLLAGLRGMPGVRGVAFGSWMTSSLTYSSQPFRYSRTRYLFASGTFVIFMLAASYSILRPARSATAARLNASEIPPACEKSAGEGCPPRQAATNSLGPRKGSLTGG